MPLIIPSELVAEKNKLYPGALSGVVGFELPGEWPCAWAAVAGGAAGGFWAELLEIRKASDGQIMRMVNGFEDVRWGGYTWSKFRFEPADINEGDDGEDKSVRINVSAIDGVVQSAVETADNLLIDDAVIYRYVHTAYPDLGPAIIGYFDILEWDAGEEWVEFEVGTENLYINAFPANTYQRNTCNYKPHQTDICPYANSAACDKTFSSCILLGRASIYGGQPGIPGGVWNV